jgi:hypothetical protein
LSLSRPASSLVIEARGAFFWPGGERGPGENPWFDKIAGSDFARAKRARRARRTDAPSTNCEAVWTAAGAFRPYGSPQGVKTRDAIAS